MLKNRIVSLKVIDEKGNVTASLRSYNEPKEVEVTPGTYKVSIQALGDMKGMATNTEIENIIVNAGNTTPISFNFETGIAFIDAKVGSNSIDSVVTIDDEASGKNVAGGRTYSRGKAFILNPGTYKVKVSPLGDFKDRKAQTFTNEVKKGEHAIKTVDF